jgi:hypothetical protein
VATRKAWMRRAALYAASGGFLTAAFSVLGGQDAQAAPKPPAVIPKAIKAAPKPVAKKPPPPPKAKRVVKPKTAAKPKPQGKLKPSVKPKTTVKPKAAAKPKIAAKPATPVRQAARFKPAQPKPITQAKRSAKATKPLIKKSAPTTQGRKPTTKAPTQAKRNLKAAPAVKAGTQPRFIGQPKPAPTQVKPRTAPKPKALPQSLRLAEAAADRQAKTHQQYQQKKQTTQNLQKTAPARTAYTQSQRSTPRRPATKKPTTPKPKALPQSLRLAEAAADRQAKTHQQYQQKKQTTQNLQKTAPARSAYTQSQRGGPPGTTQRKQERQRVDKAAGELRRTATARADYAESQRGGPPGTTQQKQQRQRTDKAAGELRRTATARADYAESQRGGPPGTTQQKQQRQRTDKAASELRRTATARADYAESQRGGAPGSGLARQVASAREKSDRLAAVRDRGPTGSARAFEVSRDRAADAKAEVVRLEGREVRRKQQKEQREERARQAQHQEKVRAAQAQVDYNDSQAGRPVGERTGLVVEHVAPAVSRVTNPKTGEVSINNFRLGENAPPQERLIPLLSEKARADAKSCPIDQCDAAPSKHLGWKTAENVADLCVSSAVECGDDFALEVAATVSNGGVRPAGPDDAQEQLIAQGLSAPIPSLTGPPTGLLPKGSPPPPPVPEPRVAPRPPGSQTTGTKVDVPPARGNPAPPQGPPPAAGPNQGRQQPDRPNGNVVDGVRLRARLAGQEIAGGHAYGKHVVEQGEFRGIHSRADFAKVIENTIVSGESRVLSGGRTAYWHEGVVVIRNPRAADGGSAFAPTQGRQYFLNLK